MRHMGLSFLPAPPLGSARETSVGILTSTGGPRFVELM